MEPYPHEQVTVNEVMEKKVHTVKETDDLNIALKQMRSNHVGRLPVVNQEGKLTGILSLHNVIAKTLDTKKNLGDISSPGENVVKTIKAVTDRYLKQGHTEKAEKYEPVL